MVLWLREDSFTDGAIWLALPVVHVPIVLAALFANQAAMWMALGVRGSLLSMDDSAAQIAFRRPEFQAACGSASLPTGPPTSRIGFWSDFVRSQERAAEANRLGRLIRRLSPRRRGSLMIAVGIAVLIVNHGLFLIISSVYLVLMFLGVYFAIAGMYLLARPGQEVARWGGASLLVSVRYLRALVTP